MTVFKNPLRSTTRSPLRGPLESKFGGSGLTAQLSSALSYFSGQTGVSFNYTDSVAIERGYDYTGAFAHRIWRRIKRGYWMRDRYDYIDQTQRMSGRKSWMHEVYAIYKAGDATKSGTWSDINSSSSGPSAVYIGNKARSASAANAYLEFDITPDDGLPYDVVVFYMQRTSGGYFVPTIDGSQTLLDAEIVDPDSLGERAFSTYGAVDLLRQQKIKIASGLTGDHTVRLRLFGNSIVPPGSSNGFGYIEAVGATAEIGDSKTYSPRWVTSTAYVIGDEIQASNGIYYKATTAGTSGATEPTHTSSTASDGAVTWHASGGGTSSLWFKPVNTDFVSEREYAIVNATKNAVSEDVGGQTHLNDNSTARVITVDDVAWSEATSMGTITKGSKIVITDTLDWTHPQDTVKLASGTITTTINGAYTKNEVSMTVVEAFTASSFYVGMLPYSHWDPVFGQSALTNLLARDGQADAATSHNSSNDSVAFNDVLSMCAYGTLTTFGKTLANVVAITEDGIRNFSDGGRVFALVNINAIPTNPGSGGTTGAAKVYFERASTGTPESFVADDVIEFENHQFCGIN